jgi:putative colanic acid biosysnthesis UDP-glucose lipid carrier transferase
MRTRNFILLFFLIDLILLNGSIFFAYWIKGIHYSWPPDTFTIVLNVGHLITYLILIDDMQYLKTTIENLLRSLGQRLVTLIAICSVVLIVFKIRDFIAYQFLGSIFLFIILKLLLSLFLFYKMTLRKRGRTPVIIIGNNKIAHEVYWYCKNNKFSGYKPLGILAESIETKSDQGNIIGTMDDFQAIYDKTPFNDAIISVPMNETDKIKQYIHMVERIGVKPRVVLNWYNVINYNFQIQPLGSIPLLDIRNVPLHKYANRFWKRAFDLFFSIILLILLLPVFILIAIAIKLDSKGSIFYKPIRLGVNGKPFKLYKFRSMNENDDAKGGTRSTAINDERITRLGKFLRKSNLDELPQFFNVLMNEMSVVGPRPHRVTLNRDLQKKMSTYMVRHLIKPGITGWAQVNGWRGPTESKIQYTGRTLHDIWYIENWSFLIDIYILFLTIFGKKTRKNAF